MEKFDDHKVEYCESLLILANYGFYPFLSSISFLVVVLSQQHLGLLSSDVGSLDVDQPGTNNFSNARVTRRGENILKCKDNKAIFTTLGV